MLAHYVGLIFSFIWSANAIGQVRYYDHKWSDMKVKNMQDSLPWKNWFKKNHITFSYSGRSINFKNFSNTMNSIVKSSDL